MDVIEVDGHNHKVVGHCQNCGSDGGSMSINFAESYIISEYTTVKITCKCGHSGMVQLVPYLVENTLEWEEVFDEENGDVFEG